MSAFSGGWGKHYLKVYKILYQNMKEDTYCEFDKITQPEMCGFGALFEYLV